MLQKFAVCLINLFRDSETFLGISIRESRKIFKFFSVFGKAENPEKWENQIASAEYVFQNDLTKMRLNFDLNMLLASYPNPNRRQNVASSLFNFFFPTLYTRLSMYYVFELHNFSHTTELGSNMKLKVFWSLQESVLKLTAKHKLFFAFNHLSKNMLNISGSYTFSSIVLSTTMPFSFYSLMPT